jgi:hypothetical protein
MGTLTHHPVILLLGKRSASGDEVDEWLARSPYSTTEAVDVFQALEHITDFTVESPPDVVFLHVDSFEAEMATLENMLDVTDNGASVLAFENRTSTVKGESDLGRLARQLDSLISCEARVR